MRRFTAAFFLVAALSLIACDSADASLYPADAQSGEVALRMRDVALP